MGCSSWARIILSCSMHEEAVAGCTADADCGRLHRRCTTLPTGLEGITHHATFWMRRNVQGEASKAQTITKEMDLEHLERAGFDPEAAAHEDGIDLEDLGYEEEDEEWMTGWSPGRLRIRKKCCKEW